MGKFFDNQFNKGQNEQPCNCPECRMGKQPEIEADEMMIDLNIADPNEIINAYFAQISNADTPEEVFELLTKVFFEGADFGEKNSLIEDIQVKIQILNDIQNGVE